MKSPARIVLLLGGLALLTAVPEGASAQGSDEGALHVETLKREHPDMYDVLMRIERAHGVLFGQLALEGETLRGSGEDLPTFGFEFDMVERLSQLVQETGPADDAAAEAAAGFGALGERAAAIIAWGNVFYREVMGILADPELRTMPERREALAAALERYRSRPDVALPVEPKSMDILYEHDFHERFRTGYADLDGVIWAGHWLKLAATEPLTDFPEWADRQAGLDTVTTRFYSKLSYGEPPQFFPSELPMAPAIAPGLIFLSPETAMVWDNLTMLQEVLADILVAFDATDVHAAIEDAVDHFMDPGYEVTDQGGWESMALGHGIFFQGGYPLGVMTESELNVGGHAAHLRAGGNITIPGMPG